MTYFYDVLAYVAHFWRWHKYRNLLVNFGTDLTNAVWEPFTDVYRHKTYSEGYLPNNNAQYEV